MNSRGSLLHTLRNVRNLFRNFGNYRNRHRHGRAAYRLNPGHRCNIVTSSGASPWVAALETKLKQEKAKKQQIEARKRAAESKAKRSGDTRRKIASLLAKVERGEWPQDELLSMLDASLTRDDDRALFDLPADLFREV